MPYIKSKIDRKILDDIIESYGYFLKHPGYLNYFLHKLAKTTCEKYEDHRSFGGELLMTILEIYRRQTAPYEDEKKEENGDV